MKSKKLLTILLSVVMILSLTSGVSAAEAASVRLSRTSISMNVGASTTLKVLNTSGKVTWTSSRNSVVNVKPTGKRTAKITALKEGRTTVTAKVNGKRYRCTVTAKQSYGSKQNPFIAAKGVTYKSKYGKVTYKAEEILMGSDAEKVFSVLDPDSWEYNKNDKEDGYWLIAVRYDVKVLGGYDRKIPFDGYEIINWKKIYNEKGTKHIDKVKPCSFNSTEKFVDIDKLELYKGDLCMAYAFLWVPDDVKVFSTNNSSGYWIRYVLPD